MPVKRPRMICICKCITSIHKKWRLNYNNTVQQNAVLYIYIYIDISYDGRKLIT